MSADNTPAAEVDVDATLVRALLADQLPDLRPDLADLDDRRGRVGLGQRDLPARRRPHGAAAPARRRGAAHRERAAVAPDAGADAARCRSRTGRDGPARARLSVVVGAWARGCPATPRPTCRPTISTPPRRRSPASCVRCINRHRPTRRRTRCAGCRCADRAERLHAQRRSDRRASSTRRRCATRWAQLVETPRVDRARPSGCTATCVRPTCSCTTGGSRR